MELISIPSVVNINMDIPVCDQCTWRLLEIWRLKFRGNTRGGDVTGTGVIHKQLLRTKKTPPTRNDAIIEQTYPARAETSNVQSWETSSFTFYSSSYSSFFFLSFILPYLRIIVTYASFAPGVFYRFHQLMKRHQFLSPTIGPPVFFNWSFAGLL